MKLSRTMGHHPALFSLVPMVNVLFLVVVFFALSSRFVLQPGIAVGLPFSSFTLAPQRNAQIISIVAGPKPAVYFQEREIAATEVGSALAQLLTKDRTVIVRADRAIPYDLVMRVTNEALRAGFSIVLAAEQEQK
ncbi:MAG: biopolymer transport protein ExbD [Chthoniobacter sp.]|jgi:biopolymer transport protein ExbD|nr:biopolymer transport protein ExbD [Chthoniobacter sp.]